MSAIAFQPAIPILFVRDDAASAAFYEAALGFGIDFLHGEPPFYGSLSRGSARLHLRFVHQPTFAVLAAREESLILVTIEVSDVHVLFDELRGRRAAIAQRPTDHP